MYSVVNPPITPLKKVEVWNEQGNGLDDDPFKKERRSAHYEHCLMLPALIPHPCFLVIRGGCHAASRLPPSMPTPGSLHRSNAYSITGVREAVDEINARGGVLGRRFELIELDNMSTPIGSKVAAEKAIAGGYCHHRFKLECPHACHCTCGPGQQNALDHEHIHK